MNQKSLNFSLSKTSKEIEDLYNYNVDVFMESPDFKWSVDNLKQQQKEGWEIYSVKVGEEIIAAAFLKPEKDTLLTQNTPIKLLYQGNGYSHQIKEFFEDKAKEENINKVINICPIDNFRMISLNETHGYTKTDNFIGDKKSLVKWIKEI